MIDPALLAELSTAEELAGGLPSGWIVQDWRVEYGIGRPGFRRLGERPVGYLLYTPDGVMSACLSRREAQSRHPTATRPTDTDKTARYDAYFSYAGRYRVEDGLVVHSLDIALDPRMLGSQQRRHARLKGDHLLLLAHDVGSTRTDFIEWRRAPAAIA